MMLAEWWMGLAGGLMIGAAAAVYLLVNGRIMGASGIVGGLIDGSDPSARAERAAFLAALIGVPAVIALLMGGAATNLTGNWAVVVVAGLLVGVGTRLAGGCTSGHGVCGISRLSLRGIVSTLIYLVAGAVTMLLFRHVLGVI
jgi:uncharacterized protein